MSAVVDLEQYRSLCALGVSSDRAKAIASRRGLGWSEPIADPAVRERAAAFAGSPITDLLPDGPPSGSAPLRSLAAIGAAMSSRDPNLHLSVTDAELDGALSAGAMLHAAHLEGRAPLPEAAPWLARRGGISEAAKRLAAIVAELQPCTAADVWERIGNALGEQEWSRFLDEAISVGIVLRTADHALVARKGPVS